MGQVRHGSARCPRGNTASASFALAAEPELVPDGRSALLVVEITGVNAYSLRMRCRSSSGSIPASCATSSTSP